MNPEQLYDQAQQLLAENNHNAAYRILKRLDTSIPSHPGILYLLAACQSLGGNKENAIKTYQRVLKIRPEFVEAMNNLGLDLRSLERHKEALAYFNAALFQQPSFFDAALNKASTLLTLNEDKAASDLLIELLAIDPNHPKVLANLGTAHLKTKNPDAALEHFQRAHSLLSNDVDIGRGYLASLHQLKRWDAIIEAGKTMPNLLLDDDRIKKSLFGAYLQTCNWGEISKLASESKDFCDALDALCIFDDPLELLAISKRQAKQYIPSTTSVTYPPQRPKSQPKIKVGYLSSDFKSHPVAFLTNGLFANHDKSLFEIHAIAIDQYPPEENIYRSKIENHCHGFHNIGHMANSDASEFIKKLELDVLVDLNGYTKDSRTTILANRCAPIQIEYLGFPGTTGAEFIDYTIGDPIITPPNLFHGFSEKVISLPECFQVNDDQRNILRQGLRADHLIPEDAFVMACFNQPTKITREMFDCWHRILIAKQNGVLWLSSANEWQVNNLVKHAESKGVDPKRLIFAPRLPYEVHLGRYELVNLVLDTYPFNGGTTTSDALWGGGAVLTRSGQTFSSRMSASLLHSVGLDELITQSLDEYESLALELADNSERLSSIRKKLRANRTSAPVFNTQRFTRHLEEGLTIAVERSRQGLKPDHIFVPLLN